MGHAPVGQCAEAYDRDKLYEEVWKEPALVVDKRYGISSVALAKACRKLFVPLPPRGSKPASQIVSCRPGDTCGIPFLGRFH